MRSFGERLRKERETRGIELDSVSEFTKINPKILRALESNRLGDLPGRVYNRGFVRAYAEYLGVDADPLLDAYEEEERRRAPVTPVLPPPESRSGLRAASRKRGKRLTKILLVLAATLSSVAGLTVALWPPNNAAPEAGGLDLTATRKRVPAGVVREAGSRDLPDRIPGGESPAPAPALPPAGPAPEATAEETMRSEAAEEEPATDLFAPRPRAPEREPAAPPAVFPAAPPAALPGGGAAARSGGGLEVMESGLGATVVDHGLVERGRTFQVGDRVWFWTRVSGATPGQLVRHHWLHEGTPVTTVDITLGGPQWRAYTRQTMGPDAVGSWTAELRDADGRVLAREGFTCTRSSRERQR